MQINTASREANSLCPIIGWFFEVDLDKNRWLVFITALNWTVALIAVAVIAFIVGRLVALAALSEQRYKHLYLVSSPISAS
jgi:hypothetical protein